MMTARKRTPKSDFEVVSGSIGEASDILKAMASDTRLKIMCALGDGEMPVGQLAELTQQSHSAVSQHLAKLRAAGLVESRRDAQTIYYRCSGGVGRALINTLCDYYR